MPRGSNPNSRANLRKYGSEKEPREEGRKGGLKSGETRKLLKSFKELDDEYTTSAERKKMLDALKRRAEAGNLKAFEVYRDTVGLKPVDKVAVSQVDQATVDELHDILEQRKQK